MCGVCICVCLCVVGGRARAAGATEAAGPRPGGGTEAPTADSRTHGLAGAEECSVIEVKYYRFSETEHWNA